MNTNTKKIFALYGDDDQLISAIKDIRSKGHHIDEVYTPFPVHGLDHVLGLKPSRLAITSFLFGMLGTAVALLMMWYIMIYNWPQNFGGKPSFSLIENLPSFIPITFELTVMFAAHLMCITYLIRCKLYPGSSSTSPDPRTTDDKFLLEMHFEEEQETALRELFSATGAEEIKTQE